jgi:hypothetical protein
MEIVYSEVSVYFWRTKISAVDKAKSGKIRNFMLHLRAK